MANILPLLAQHAFSKQILKYVINIIFFACQLYSLDRPRYLQAIFDNLTSNDFLFRCGNQTDEFKESLFLKVGRF